MDRKTQWIAGAAVTITTIAAGAGIAVASGSGEDESEREADTVLTGAALDQATAAALEHTGGGTVIESEVGDDGAAYGVEIRLDDGRVVEIGLDPNFAVIGQEIDDDGADQDGQVDD